MSERDVLLDTWGFVAQGNAADANHVVAVEAQLELARAGYRFVTTEYIFDETLTTLHARAGAAVAVRFADELQARIENRTLMLIEINAVHRADAMAFFRRLAPSVPRLSFTDCSSFAVMRERGIELAFTADRHFRRAGRGIRPLFEIRAGAAVARLPSRI